MSHESPAPETGQPIDYEAFQASPEFQAMKRRFRSFVFPLAIAFMLWFLLYVVLAAFAHEFMAQPLWGMNVGLWFGLAQFVTTFAITMWYVSFANKRLDPVTTALRAELETLEAGGAVAGAEGGVR
ncbi:uncharacterized membrane protein (DUF485 family) [Leucobacter exalbidus]|uniref:Uncharacterized membrane protein (DUF485 family) n=1 Tax=Leucobacter exalbidus TaxID=662960 RepID=A0A940PTJ2_9MICO|nr:DUF485 domain-containing protein [Leucobacter exalbidus]MBP1324966.1 uncharacterized membrane protein (DUF485 family) [Leucobacter exalbidus]